MALQRPVFYQKPLPADCINLREDGNNKFRSGQYAEASLVYTQLVQKLETDETQLLNLSLIYSNRAACGLKMGELAGSVQDCTRSLLLVPHQVKPLLRRATAYEHLGRYQLAYCDNRHVLLLDSYIDQAHLSYIDQAHLGTKRCQQMLNQKDGARWREKLKLPTVSPWEIPEIVDINSKPSIVSQLQFPTQDNMWDGGCLQNSQKSSLVEEDRGTGQQQQTIRFLLMTDVQIKVELGHRATRRSRPTKEGFTHDWTVYVRGPDQHSIVHFVEKVVFHLHSTFENPERVVREPPYAVQEMGYAGFELPIDIYFRNKAEPKKIKFVYNLFLHMEDSINHVRCEKLTFQNPTEEFRKKLLKGGGAMAAGPGNREIAAQYAAQVAQVAKAAGNQPDSGNMNSVSPHQQPPHATQSPQQPGMPSQMPPSSHMNQSLPMTVPPQMMDRYGGIVMETDAQNLPPICAYTHQPKHAPTLALGSFTRFSRRDVGSMGLVVESLEQSSGDSVDAGQYSHVLDAPKKERAKKKAKDYDKMDLKGTDMDAFTDTKSKHSASTYSSHTNSARNKPSDPPDDWGWAQVPSANSDTYKPPKGALKLGGGPGKAPAADYSWIDTEFAPIEDAGVQPASAYDCGQGLDTGGQDFFSMGGSSSSKYSASTYSSHTNSARNKPSDPPDDWGWGQVPSANSDTYKPPKGALKLGGGPGKAPAEDYSWIDTEFAPIKDAGVQPASAYDWGQGLYTGGQHFFSMGGSSSDEACDSIPDSRSSSSSQYESDDEWDVERKKQAAVMEKDKGNDYFKRRDYDNAIECFTKGAELDPTNSLLPANRAMALLKQNKFAAAEIDCTVSLTLDPLYTKAYLRRGVARLGLTQFSAAKEDYERVLQLEPQNLKAKTDLETIEKFERKFDRNRIENVPQEHLQQRLIRQAMKAAPEPTDIEALSANPATPMGDNSSIIVPMGDNSRQIVPTGSAVLPGVSDQMERSPSVGTLSVPSENEATSDETSGYGSVNQGKIIYDQNIELGRGHNSVVYRGRFEDRQVAVKCINCSSNKAAAETVDDIRKLNREIAIMNKIDQMGHEHIIRYYESQRKETKVYLVLELCDGTLNDYVKTPAWQQKLSPTAVTLHMARGLHYLFSINVTHRDIRPENVFIKSIDMTSAKAVIADFGQSKVTVGNLYSFTGAFGGQGYIAPEAYDAMLQSSPDEQVATHISSHADMFSLGCLFYFTLTDGAHPFGVNNLVAQDNIHNRKSPVFDKLPKCQYAMEQLIALMIRMKPEDRPSPTQILKHPALWPSDKVLKYFCDASDCLDEVTLQAGYVPDPPKNNWLQNLPNGTRHYLEGYRSGKAYGGRGNKAASHPKAAYHLKAIRNLETHFKDIPENVRNEMGDSNDDHVKFWLTANPTFLMHVYYKMSTCPEKLSSYDQI